MVLLPYLGVYAKETLFPLLSSNISRGSIYFNLNNLCSVESWRVLLFVVEVLVFLTYFLQMIALSFARLV